MAGCGMSDSEVRQRAGDVAVGSKHLLEGASEKGKEAFQAASDKAKDLVKGASEKMDDAMLKAKVLAGFKLMDGLDTSKVTVEAQNGKVILNGTVPTETDRLKVIGVAYGITGNWDRVESHVTVAK